MSASIPESATSTAKAVSLFSAKWNFRRLDTICHRSEYPGLRQGGSTEIRGRGGAASAAQLLGDLRGCRLPENR
jgi:hypothetical protein